MSGPAAPALSVKPQSRALSQFVWHKGQVNGTLHVHEAEPAMLRTDPRITGLPAKRRKGTPPTPRLWNPY